MIGRTFGQLRVLERAGSCKGGALYRCACPCGGERVARGVDLRRGHVTTCGHGRRSEPALPKARRALAPVASIEDTYGRLRVLARAGSTRRGEALYQCACSCGSSVRVRATSLRSGRTTSCGCLRREVVAQTGDRAAPMEQTYGRLTVLERTGSDNNGEALYMCLCSCGERAVIRGRELRRGHTTSCGCLRRERAAAAMLRVLGALRRRPEAA